MPLAGIYYSFEEYILKYCFFSLKIKMEKCIYCNNQDNLTDSHIIPECLGANRKLKYAVCKDCNSFLGRTIEAKICSDFDFYRFLAQIKTKKRKHPTTQAELEVLGNKVTIFIGEGGLPKSIPPIILDEGPPRQYLVVAESPKKLKKYMRKFEKSRKGKERP